VDPWNARLKAYAQTNMGRLLNCTVSFKNESQQIIVLDGAYSQDTGGWTDLAGSGTMRIVVDVSAELRGTSLLWIYLEVLKPGTKIYLRNEILLRID